MKIRFTAVLPALLLASGCGDPPIAPTAAEQNIVRRAPSSVAYSYTDGTGAIVVLDNDGTTYRFSSTDQTIYLSDGSEILLDSEQAVAAEVAFRGILEADQVAGDLQTLGPLQSCENPLPENAGGCAASLRASESGESGAGPSLGPGNRSRIRVEYLGPTPQLDLKKWRHVGSTTRSARQTGPGVLDSSTRAVASYYGGDVCTDVANAALPTVWEYQGKRTTFLKTATKYGSTQIINEVVRRVLPRGTLAAALFLADIAEQQYARVAVHFLGGMWNSYGCSTTEIHAGPVIRYEPGSTQRGGELECHEEYAAISFDDGNTFYPIWITVCEFRMS